MPSASELVQLLTAPNERLTLEYKSWLDLTSNAGKATLAKAAIALANEGGGIIIFGMRAVENGPLASQQMPNGMARYNQDQVNSAINRFADPEIHCELLFAAHPITGVEHAFVVVPGGMIVPVMSTRDQQGEISARRCYVRKPGPRSEEPFTAEEWRGVLERCLQARRESMLDAIRLIVEGRTPPPPAILHDQLNQFCERAHQRWLQLIETAPADDPSRMGLGHYRICFEIMGVREIGSFNDLRRLMEEARRVRHTGWGPFVSLTRADMAPNIVDGTIEAWLGLPEAERFVAGPQHCDFWRASRAGFFYLQRGFDEDGMDRVDAGTAFDVTLPIWRVGETLLYAARLARLLGENPEIYARVHYSGLQNRQLVSINDFFFQEGGRSRDNEATLEAQVTASQIDDNLVEVLFTFLSPLYEQFDFYELSRDLVAREVERMRRNRM